MRRWYSPRERRDWHGWGQWFFPAIWLPDGVNLTSLVYSGFRASQSVSQSINQWSAAVSPWTVSPSSVIRHTHKTCRRSSRSPRLVPNATLHITVNGRTWTVCNHPSTDTHLHANERIAAGVRVRSTRSRPLVPLWWRTGSTASSLPHAADAADICYTAKAIDAVRCMQLH